MSFSITGDIMRNTIRIGAIADNMSTRIQAAMAKTAEQGLEFLRNDAGLPIDEGDLQASTSSGTNQSSIWFRASISPRDGKPYGAAQNYGWHDRGGHFHEGHFFMERTEQMAAALLAAYIGMAWADAGGIGGGRVGSFAEGFADARFLLFISNPQISSAADIANAHH